MCKVIVFRWFATYLWDYIKKNGENYAGGTVTTMLSHAHSAVSKIFGRHCVEDTDPTAARYYEEKVQNGTRGQWLAIVKDWVKNDPEAKKFPAGLTGGRCA